MFFPEQPSPGNQPLCDGIPGYLAPAHTTVLTQLVCESIEQRLIQEKKRGISKMAQAEKSFKRSTHETLELSRQKKRASRSGLVRVIVCPYGRTGEAHICTARQQMD